MAGSSISQHTPSSEMQANEKDQRMAVMVMGGRPLYSGSAVFAANWLAVALRGSTPSGGRRHRVSGDDAGRSRGLRRVLTVCVRAGVQLQVLHVFAVQLHVELLQGAVPLPQSCLQAADALHVLLHQAGLQSHTCSRPSRVRGLKYSLTFFTASFLTSLKGSQRQQNKKQQKLPSPE